MYPDPITPRAHPDLLAQVDYDPFDIMPTTLPSAPRVFTTGPQLERARQRLAQGNATDQDCLARLITACELDEALPSAAPPTEHPDWGGPLLPWLQAAFHNALAWRVTDDVRHRTRALEAMRLAAQGCADTPAWNGYETNEANAAGRAYDLLATPELEAEDDRRFREMLNALMTAQDFGNHRGCNNHNTMGMAARMSVAVALGDRQAIHDVFYGTQRGGQWRYGMIHTLRHDFLADGMQWEGTAGYHNLVLGMVCECFTMMEHLGVDLWHREWPALMQDDGFDEHRGWGPKGMKALTAAFDALLYQTFANGDYSLLHDQGLGNLRGAQPWWPVFNKAFEVYGEPRYAWALRQINDGKIATAGGAMPKWFAGERDAPRFVRLEGRDLPAGENPLATDRQLSLTGRHVAGCSLFPSHGSAVLRSDATDENALGAYLYWGPHSAGHRAPAALHLEVHAGNQRITNAPHLYADGYQDPRHLTWARTTIAHNTVTIDQESMFPYDFPSESLWECDHWRDTISDGKLLCFQPGPDFQAVRAANDNVYRGVELDRTVVLTPQYLLDVYRVTAERSHLLDWAMHCHGKFAAAPDSEPIDLGQNRGYRHLEDARIQPQDGPWLTVPFQLDTLAARADIWLGTPKAKLILAHDPEPDSRRPAGDQTDPEPRTSLIVRTETNSALFISVWSFNNIAATGGEVTGSADADVTVEIAAGSHSSRWSLPLSGDVRALEQ